MTRETVSGLIQRLVREGLERAGAWLKRWEHLGGIGPDSYILPHMARRAPGDRDKKKNY